MRSMNKDFFFFFLSPELLNKIEFQCEEIGQDCAK